MTEISFPRLEEEVNQDQWKSITLGIGDGCLDERGNPYNLVDLNNVTNTGVIAVDTITGYNHAILKGYYHKMDAPITVSFPPVATDTTYSVALVYDPLNQAMPVSLKVLTSMPRTNGKEYLLLWQVPRKPNQLLTDATPKKFRPTISPVIQVDYPENLPPYASQLFGTRAMCLYTGEEFKATFTKWKKISAEAKRPKSMGGWEIVPKTGGIVAQPVDNGFLYTLGAALRRATTGYYLSTDFSGQGNTLGTPIPAELCPDDYVYFTALSTNTVLEGRITPAGVLQMRSTTGSPFYINQNAGMSFQVSWFTSESPDYIAR